MPALNFSAFVVPHVEDGSKRMTIRSMRKRPFQAGDRLALYTGMRQKSCRKLREEVCTSVSTIVIREVAYETEVESAVFHTSKGGVVVIVDGQYLGRSDAEDLAWRDGFRQGGIGEGLAAFIYQFADWYGLPFTGQIIRW